MFPPGAVNQAICFSDVGSRTNFVVLAVEGIADLHFGSSIDAYQQVALYRYEKGQRLDNITDWALKQFTNHYKAGPGTRLPGPTKRSIFHYVYAVLHDPAYREKYALNLKREFPRIPLHGNVRAHFWHWAQKGEALMALHIGYETVEPWPLRRVDKPDTKARVAGQAPKCILKSEPEAGRIVVDSETMLSGVPPAVWGYGLGNRSALDWVLDQHKEKKAKDPTIREKFDTFRFANHKERVIALLARVVRVSVETMALVASLKDAPR
jgi:predicted helicase